ncbi:LysR family transcriptional regulator [Planctomycetota bacterium]|nr:LysR family transcriptional regulator [Planctomycetota bacterium]
MSELNFNHLQAFWSVVRAGGVNAAARQGFATASTISEQVRKLETSLNVRLLRKKGRNVEPTERGRQVFGYAEEIFALGRELELVALGQMTAASRYLRISAEMCVPKLLVRQFLQPVLSKHSAVRLVCREGSHDEVLRELGAHQAEVVLTDRAATGALHSRLYYHPLGESGVCLMASEEQAKSARKYSGTYDGVPMLLPANGTSLRAAFDRWAASKGVAPHIAGEFDDTALMKEFASTGAGVVVLPQVVENVARKQFGLRRVRLLEGVSIEYFAITLNRRITDPVVETLVAEARRQLK